MQKKKIIRKIAVLVAWLLVGSSMIILLAAANNNKDEHICKEVLISIKGSGEKYFIEKNDILNRLKETVSGGVIGKEISSVSLSYLERVLVQNPWIKEAQLYFDSRNVLHVVVLEREPIARVFTSDGGSFYLDAAGTRMPVLNKVSIRLPVVTNFTAAKKWNANDSLLVKDLTSLLAYINEDDFWKAQIAQIDVRSNRELELIPVVGNHIIKLGRVENIDEKLNNLLLFYKQVLSKTGLDLYKVVDIQYAGQVIGIKTNPSATIDSIQLQRNIEALIESTKAQALNDSLFSIKATQFIQAKDSVGQRLNTVEENPNLERKPVSGSAQQSISETKSRLSNANDKPRTNQSTPQQPRAVMPRKGG